MNRFSMISSPYPHQIPAIEKLSRPRVGAAFMEMGTGKTFVALNLVHSRQSRINRVIIYCPVSGKETWYEEIRKHTDVRPCDICLFDERTNIRSVPRSASWLVIGIESMSSSDRVALAAHDLTTSETFVIADEGSYIKGHRARRTQRITRYSEDSRYRLLLNGTPISQGYEDLYAQMNFLSPKILGYGSFYSFAANHLEYSEKYKGLVVRAHNTSWLAAKMNPYIYQITKEEAGLNLPPKLYDSRYFPLAREQREAYEQAKYEILMDAEEVDSYVIFHLFTVLQQIASGFWKRDGCLLEFPHRRVEMLLDYMEDVGDQEKVIIWTKFRHSVRQITEELAGKYGRDSVAQYYGDLNEKERAAELARWRREARFIVATMETGGHVQTWNEAAYSLFYENEFKYANRLQAEDRNHRIGQGRRPTYTNLWAQCGIEERIAASHAKKGDTVRDFRREVDRLKDLKGKELKKAVLELL
jgi:SNF2 family DNA or RNA helicase